jgi:hypothetical protein
MPTPRPFYQTPRIIASTLLRRTNWNMDAKHVADAVPIQPGVDALSRTRARAERRRDPPLAPPRYPTGRNSKTCVRTQRTLDELKLRTWLNRLLCSKTILAEQPPAKRRRGRISDCVLAAGRLAPPLTKSTMSLSSPRQSPKSQVTRITHAALLAVV